MARTSALREDMAARARRSWISHRRGTSSRSGCSFSARRRKRRSPRPAIGIVYVNGPIQTGKGMASPFGGDAGAFSSDVREALEKAGADRSIKAVVLRVDSPGGSATASEIILDATRRLKAKKPFVVSMGDVAGSGGYYVACGADTIFADATTLTGSIGVLGGKLATTEMWRKIGVTFKEYKRGQNAGIFSTDEVFTESERARVKALLDEVYDGFKKHVTDIRGTGSRSRSRTWPAAGSIRANRRWNWGWWTVSAR
jgi:protease-4